MYLKKYKNILYLIIHFCNEQVGKWNILLLFNSVNTGFKVNQKFYLK